MGGAKEGEEGGGGRRKGGRREKERARDRVEEGRVGRSAG